MAQELKVSVGGDDRAVLAALEEARALSDAAASGDDHSGSKTPPPPLIDAEASEIINTGDDFAPAARPRQDQSTIPLNMPAPEPGSDRRSARRRPAGAPSNGRIAANDDVPSIGGLLYALQQSPSRRPFFIASVASCVWIPLAIIFGWAALLPDWGTSRTIGEFLARPAVLAILGTTLIPVALFWFLAQLIWRAQELRLMSSAMSEVAIRLAEPDRMAEQSIASLGQAVRRQVSFMNEAVSRALGRAGELEALVHNEVAALDRSYRENEHKIRSLIKDLSGERHALVNTGDQVSETLRSLSGEVPALIDKLSQQQLRLTGIIESAGQNLIQLETSVASSANHLEATLGNRTEHLQAVLGDFSTTMTAALGSRTERLQVMLEQYGDALGTALGMRADQMETLFEQHARTLDATLASRAEALDAQLIERTRALDVAFSDRLQALDESILRSTLAIDGAVGEKAQALTSALQTHAKDLTESLGRQATQIDESLLQGLSAVRRSSENITRQSVKAIEGLSSQADMLRNVSENLLSQINSVTTRFEGQGQSILKAANALESANFRIDATLQNRNAELSETLDQLTGKAADFDRVLRGYSSSVEGTLNETEGRARELTHQLAQGAETSSRAALLELERLKSTTDTETRRALDEIKDRFSNISREVNDHIGSMSDRFSETSEEMRRRAQESAQDLATEQLRIREQIEMLPKATRESTDAMRSALQEQLRALDQLSSLTTREQRRRDITPPAILPPRPHPSLTAAFTETGQPVRGENGQFSAIADSLAQEFTQRPVNPPGPQGGGPPSGSPHMSAQAPGQPPAQPLARSGPDGRDNWSLGDLLARASRDDTPPPMPAPQRVASAQAPAGGLNIDSIARALDVSTASAIWSRFRSGQRGIMVRSIYTADGRTIFDEISRRYRSEAEMRSMVDRYLQEFERVMGETERRDPSGRLLQGYLVSESGRVYLFLAHAAGRLS